MFDKHSFMTSHIQYLSSILVMNEAGFLSQAIITIIFLFLHEHIVMLWVLIKYSLRIRAISYEIIFCLSKYSKYPPTLEADSDSTEQTA